MDDKIKALLIYLLGIIGLIIAFVTNKDPKSEFVSYHMRQGIGLVIVSFLLAIISTVLAIILAMISPKLAMLSYIPYLAYLYMWIMGIVNSLGEKMEPLPILGKQFENWFKSIG